MTEHLTDTNLAVIEQLARDAESLLLESAATYARMASSDMIDGSDYATQALRSIQALQALRTLYPEYTSAGRNGAPAASA